MPEPDIDPEVLVLVLDEPDELELPELDELRFVESLLLPEPLMLELSLRLDAPERLSE